MNTFRFIHAADLHLGSPFQGLALKDEEIAARFARATRDAFSALVRRAIDEKVNFVIVAGDVYDGEWRDNSIGLFFNRELARLVKAGIAVFLLKGNHDADSVVTRSITLPAEVHNFDTRKPQSIQIDGVKVVLHGQGFADRWIATNMATIYPQRINGLFNIGVLHTSLNGRPPHANYAPCSLQDLHAHGYDYWALGHVHEYEVVSDDPYVIFPGNLQGRNIRETGAKGAVLVTVEDGRVASIERVIVDEARWSSLTIDVTGLDDLIGVLHAIEKQVRDVVTAADERLVALRLHLVGTTRFRAWLVANRSLVVDEVQGACQRVHPDVWLEKLVIDVVPPARIEVHATTGAGLDLETLLETVERDPQTLEQATLLVADIVAKLPGGLGAAELPLGEDLVTLLAEARELVLHRAAEVD
ncbi:DNA repair exonuclease [Aquibium sp. ELW1220]|uniref:metallophosphoesterase family protein n=1 Tax=Aquibium sp. ELW1220 TaxID=2976766 RepID=UPI0025B1E43B|nr:DNA repair exonuclease [Aquibium sp. ELW1220]MDN2582149.1 DNA repair exonuclease [Aquibium sp. ELW1220]